MPGRNLPPHVQLHALGAVIVVALAGLMWLVVFRSDLTHPGTRVSVLLGGMLVTTALLVRDLHDAWPIAYTVAFLGSLALFVALGA